MGNLNIYKEVIMNVLDAINKFKADIPTKGDYGDWSVSFYSKEIFFDDEFVCSFDSFTYCVAMLSCYGYKD